VTDYGEEGIEELKTVWARRVGSGEKDVSQRSKIRERKLQWSVKPNQNAEDPSDWFRGNTEMASYP
jgi:hypothetical protein